MPGTQKRPGRQRWLTLVLLIPLLLAGACGTSDDKQKADGGDTSVNLLLPATVGLNWTTFLVAKDRFWPGMGLDVTAVGTDGSSAVVQQLVSGNAKFGLAGASIVYAAVSGEGADLKGIATLTHDDVARLSVPTDSDVQSAADLKGASIGITSAGDGSIPIVKAVMHNAGLKEGDYKLPIVGKGGPAVAQAFKSDKIQAYAHGVSDVAGLEITGKTPLRSVMPEEFLGLPGNVLVTTTKALDDPEQREIAVKIARGWLKAAAWVIDNLEESQTIACKAVPEACTDDELAAVAVKLASETTSPTDPARPGFTDPEKAKTLITAVAGSMDTPVEDVLTNEYMADFNEK